MSLKLNTGPLTVLFSNLFDALPCLLATNILNLCYCGIYCSQFCLILSIYVLFLPLALTLSCSCHPHDLYLCSFHSNLCVYLPSFSRLLIVTVLFIYASFTLYNAWQTVYIYVCKITEVEYVDGHTPTCGEVYELNLNKYWMLMIVYNVSN